MASEIICNCCYTQAAEMFQRNVKWVDCFKEMDDIKVKIARYLPMHVDFIINLTL